MEIIKFKAIFTRQLSFEEKEELRNKFQGFYFNLSEALKNGLPIIAFSEKQKDRIKQNYRKYDCIFSE